VAGEFLEISQRQMIFEFSFNTHYSKLPLLLYSKPETAIYSIEYKVMVPS
jgi:hypothetical protein